MHKRLKPLLFAVFLLPIMMGDLSVNYIFILFVALRVLLQNKMVLPIGWIPVAAVAFSLIFLFSAPFALIAPEGYLLRASVSFIIFISVLSFSVIRVTSEDIEDFRVALILFSCFMAANSLITYLFFANGAEGEDMKNIVGSQRIGFIYIMGLFVLLHRAPPSTLLRLLKLAGVVLILVGVMLTYSRSSLIALAGAIGLYGLFKAFQWRKVGVRDIQKAVGAVLVASTTAVILYLGFPSTFEFFGERILFRYGGYFAPIMPFDLLKDSAATMPADVFIEEGSEGTRLAIWSAIIQHTLQNPILGSGYLGSWVLKGVTTGSAHSQYMDVLLRVGFLGFAVWIITLYKVFRFLLLRHPDLFWGGVGILIYGLFHETFKESQGAFILAFLIGIYANYAKDRKRTTAIPSNPSALPSVVTMP